MGKEFWLRVHGGSTHFPIVLLFVSVLFDVLGLWWPDRSARRGLHFAGFGAAPLISERLAVLDFQTLALCDELVSLGRILLRSGRLFDLIDHRDGPAKRRAKP